MNNLGASSAIQRPTKVRREKEVGAVYVSLWGRIKVFIHIRQCLSLRLPLGSLGYRGRGFFPSSPLIH